MKNASEYLKIDIEHSFDSLNNFYYVFEAFILFQYYFNEY